MATFGFYTQKSWDIGMVTAGLIMCGPLRAIPAFCTGVILYRLKDHPRLQALPSINPIVLFVGWLMLAAIPKPEATPILDAIIGIICTPLLITLLLRSENRAPRWCKVAGRLSYPLYASHMAVVAMATIVFPFARSVSAIMTIGTAIALAWCIAWLNDRIQERIRRPVPAALPTPA